MQDKYKIEIQQLQNLNTTPDQPTSNLLYISNKNKRCQRPTTGPPGPTPNQPTFQGSEHI